LIDEYYLKDVSLGGVSISLTPRAATTARDLPQATTAVPPSNTTGNEPDMLPLQYLSVIHTTIGRDCVYSQLIRGEAGPPLVCDLKNGDWATEWNFFRLGASSYAGCVLSLYRETADTALLRARIAPLARLLNIIEARSTGEGNRRKRADAGPCATFRLPTG
jgi:hypothetical protein